MNCSQNFQTIMILKDRVDKHLKEECLTKDLTAHFVIFLKNQFGKTEMKNGLMKHQIYLKIMIMTSILQQKVLRYQPPKNLMEKKYETTSKTNLKKKTKFCSKRFIRSKKLYASIP